MEAGRWLRSCDAISLRLSLGLRYVKIEQDHSAQYDRGFFLDGLVDAPTEFEEFGDRTAGAVHWDSRNGR